MRARHIALALMLAGCGGRIAESLSELGDPSGGEERTGATDNAGEVDAAPHHGSRVDATKPVDATTSDAPAIDGGMHSEADADAAPPLPRITSRGSYTCATTPQHTKCWGFSNYGQLGDGANPYMTFTPQLVKWTPLDDVVAGAIHACARDHDQIVCWGSDAYGQLGHDVASDPGPSTCVDGTCFPTPVVVPGLSGVVSLAGGIYDNCAIMAGGNVSCWGRDAIGELGIPPKATGMCGPSHCLTTPTSVPGLTNVTQLALGGSVGCALRADRTVWCWGASSSGALPNVDAGAGTQPPAPVPGLDDVSSIAGGETVHVCVVRADRRRPGVLLGLQRLRTAGRRYEG